MPPTDLAGLLDRAARSDSSAFAAFYDETIDDAHQLARLSAVDVADIDLIVRGAYLDAWRASASFPGTGLSARAWLMVLVQRNASARRPRHVRHRPRPRRHPRRR